MNSIQDININNAVISNSTINSTEIYLNTNSNILIDGIIVTGQDIIDMFYTYQKLKELYPEIHI